MKIQSKCQIVAFLFMVGLGLNSFSAQAQRRESDRGDKKEYKYSKKNGDGKANRKEYYNSGNHRNDDRNQRACQDHRNGNSKKYNMERSHYSPDKNERYAYHHPKYGNVYRHFYSKPVRLRHAHGDIYYHSGNYYTYYPNVGYVGIVAPGTYIFASLPGRYERFHSGGHLYFRVGNMVFERCQQGFRLAPHFDADFSARF